MPRTSQNPKDTNFTLRIDPALKAAFSAATEAQDKPAAQVVREFMRDFVKRRERETFAAEAERQSRECAKLAEDPDSDEFQVMRELEENFNDPELWSDWKA